MSTWREVRRIARLRHDECANGSDALVSAKALLASAQAMTQIKVVGRPAGDTLLDGAEAAYDRERHRIYFSNATAQPLAQFHVAHEFAHHWLDAAGAACANADLDPLVPSEPEMSCVGDQDSYSPKERAEAQANVFAREFLLPREKLRQRCAHGIPEADLIAAEIGVPVDLVLQQLADALLLPVESASSIELRREAEPDASQLEAITASDEPRQVRAGPGTGKTRTLIGRIEYLINRGEEPGSILALTYSNLSAQDLGSRIRAAVGEKATAVWSGTFHAYGLELLRKHGHALGFQVEPRLLDRTDSLMLLEELLPQLELSHYLELHEPILKLRSILGAIGRAKDEFASPDEYMNCANAMADEATDEDSRTAAERAIEVARIYAIYETALRDRGCVDFGDLVVLPIKLLREHADIRDAVRSEKRHVLVDEYQDMNRASGLLLKELCAPEHGPWVVGDVRQSIYRFRGASPLNMARFSEEFPGATTTDLSVNYRSGGRIIRLFESFGSRMAAGASASTGKLIASRDEDHGTIQYDVATTREAEAHGIAQAILARVAAGVGFADHAILARSHTILSRLAKELEGAGVPCLYFGDFFERPEIRDLLSVLSVVSEPKGIGLLRVAQFPMYAVSPDDIRVLFEWRRQQEVTMLAALRDLEKIPGFSARGLEGLKRLADDVRDAGWPLPPHRFLMSYLLRRSAYLTPFLADDSVPGQQRRLAIYQLLQFAFSFKPPKNADPKREFLGHVRRLELLDEEKQLRQLPAAVSDIDAVRLMTIHSSKGLEFPVVHILALTGTQFPAPNRYEPCPLPPGLISSDALMSRAAEEDSLFFVGVSRAKDTLHLSRAKTNGKRTTNPSRFFESIATHLPRRIDIPAGWTVGGIADEEWPLLVGRETNDQWTAREIETYLECPRRFYYDHALELRGSDAASPFLKFQSALHSSMAWLRNTPSADERRDGLIARFEEDWGKFGPGDHPFEPLYRRMAEVMIENARTVMDGESLAAERQVSFSATGAVISCRADHVERTPKGIVVRRLKAGRLAKTEEDKPRYILLQIAIRTDHPNEQVHFEHVSLLTGERRGATDKKMSEKLKACEDAIGAAGSGNFEPRPSQRCPSCPYFFICPSHGETL
jgi:DNA helicase II / ATP-dependent DNA helicase PcrA